MNLKDYQDKSFIEVSSWGGLGPNPGSSGYLVTNDGDIVNFRVNFKAPEDEKEKEEIIAKQATEKRENFKKFLDSLGEREELKVVGKLSIEQVDDFKRYLKDEEKVFISDYKQPMIFDAGTTIVVNIDGQNREIKNEGGLGGMEEDNLYGRITKRIKQLVG